MSEPRPTIQPIEALESPRLESPHAGALRRHRAHWGHFEALIAAWLRACWEPPADNVPPPTRSHKTSPPPTFPGALLPTPPPAPTDSALLELAPFDLPIPPGVEPPPAAPDLKELAQAIVCLRRVQDARIALERGLDGGNPDAEEDGPAIDPTAIDAALSRVLGRGLARAATPPAQDPLRNGS